MKFKERWRRAGETRSDDYFKVKVPWWLRTKRFLGKPRSEEERFRDGWDTYVEDMNEGYRGEEEQ